jgi:hypothetical protein
MKPEITTKAGVNSLNSGSAKLVCASKAQADYAQRCILRRNGHAITQRKAEDGGWEMRVIEAHRKRRR